MAVIWNFVMKYTIDYYLVGGDSTEDLQIFIMVYYLLEVLSIDAF